jgi:hypothetical protein
MPSKSKTQHLVEIKAALADKYQRLARMCRSKPARERLLRHSERCRSQARNTAKSLAK